MKINTNLKIAILTYDRPHRKSREIFYGLKKKGYKKISILIQKFKLYKERKNKNFIKHRPEMINGRSFSSLIKNQKIKIKKFEKKILKNFDYILIGGSGLINKKYLKKGIFINCHSGLIPSSRGLDCAKWDILNEKISGCTLHFIDENVDKGNIISHKITKIKKSDGIYDFFQNHYKNEINMLVNFEKYLKNPFKLKLKLKKANMRMNEVKDKNIEKKFKSWKNIQLKYLETIR